MSKTTSGEFIVEPTPEVRPFGGPHGDILVADILQGEPPFARAGVLLQRADGTRYLDRLSGISREQAQALIDAAYPDRPAGPRRPGRPMTGVDKPEPSAEE